MRIIAEIKYVTTIESDVSEEMIYAFRDSKDIVVLARKNDKFFWNSLSSVSWVWHKKYDTIEDAISKLMLLPDYKEKDTSEVVELESTMEFILWSAEQLKIEL